ncbi:MAG: hypothetical protein KIS75_14130 [Chromatiales bacterium]|nr:hypothetical protein [Chromatiales bacterium]
MFDIYLSFIITWTVVLVPPAFVRLVRRKALTKTAAVVLCVALYFANIVLFTALGSESKSHGALMIGAVISYFVFRWQTKASAAKAISDRRKELGYDE